MLKEEVGKSTLTIMLARALASTMPSQNITVIDTDLQRTTTEFLTISNPEINIEFLPITPAFENTNISLVHQFIKQNEFRPGHVVIIDTPAEFLSKTMEFSRRKLRCISSNYIK